MKKLLSILLAICLLLGTLPITGIAADWNDISVGDVGFHYGDSGFMKITMPSTEGYYTYGTASKNIAAETAANVTTLPSYGWQWAVKKENDGYRMILNDFMVSYGGSTDGLMFDCPLTLELRGNNSLTATRNKGSMISGNYNSVNKLTILGSGSLTITGGMFGFNVDNSINVTGGTITVSVGWSAIRMGKLELGTGMTAQVSDNADGTGAVDFNGNNTIKKYLKVKGVTYTVTFNKNGGNGTMDTVTDVLGEYTLPECGFTAPSNKAFKAWSVDGVEKNPGEKITVNTNITVTAIWQNVTKYYIWVGGVQVTSANASAITGAGISGTASYDPATNTLTLNNATITGYDQNTGIRTSNDLIVKLIGSNIVEGQYNNGNSNYGMYISGALTFIGDGSLTASAEETTGANSWTVAILATKDITVERGCTIIATSKPSKRVSAPILPYSGGKVIMVGSKVTASTDISGTPTTAYNENNLRSYRYIKIEPAITSTVTVTNGIGGGDYTEGTSVTITANTPETGKQFKEWTGVEDLNFTSGSATTATATFTMPAKAVNISATYEDIPHTCTIEAVAKVKPTCQNVGKEAYYKCEGCGKFFEDANGKIIIADISTWGNLEKLDHTPSDWKSNSSIHWKVCSAAGCGVVISGSSANHTSTGENVATCQSQATCDICGRQYGDLAEHNTNNIWSKDDSGHWHDCETSGCIDKVDFAAHTPDHEGNATQEYDIKCSICEYLIEQLTYTPGDINDDGNVDLTDVVALAQYVADWELSVNESALDVDGDKSVDLLDVVILAQYVAGWDVEIF